MRLFGHPIHPMLVHFPITLWTVAVGAYVASAAGVTGPVDMIAKFANSGGLIVAMLAMLGGRRADGSRPLFRFRPYADDLVTVRVRSRCSL